MVDKISRFKLTNENAKEYFFLNSCKISHIDRNGRINSDKFRSYHILENTLSEWTNEWLKSRILYSSSDMDFALLDSILEDFSDRIDKTNALLLIELYDLKLKSTAFNTKKELDILYHFEKPLLLDTMFEYGLINIAYRNNLLIERNELLMQFITINSVIHEYDDEFISRIKKRFGEL